jgi:hypothetical protein
MIIASAAAHLLLGEDGEGDDGEKELGDGELQQRKISEERSYSCWYCNTVDDRLSIGFDLNEIV